MLNAADGLRDEDRELATGLQNMVVILENHQFSTAPLQQGFASVSFLPPWK